MRKWPTIRLPVGSVRIGLSKTGIAVLRTGGRRRTVVLADQALAEAAVSVPERLATQCRIILNDSACRGLPLRVTLADNWARLFVVTPPHNSARLDDCQAAASMRFQALYGTVLDEWQLEADWDARHPFLACAVPRTLICALQQIAQENQLHLVDVAPQFVRMWNRWHKTLRNGSWFGIVQDRTLVLAAIAQQRLCAVRATAVPVDGDARSWLQQQVMREALRLNLPLPKQLQLCGDQARYWVSADPSDEVFNCFNLEDTSNIRDDNAVSNHALTPEVALARSGMRS
ncbi:hypothetical protein SAMN04515618_1146 [Collimonas sp. OK307]|uniref:hypothetical protein n=1 Tax=Collimonas sp. OK307 TaxID=1801620 RepID=UPI0008E59F3B|nr:hypothetical protein [Collimonas sp. OK307]SFI21967.1 hypothetical protein SAMN04515618_1146 [Collimonas sp. OK307]